MNPDHRSLLAIIRQQLRFDKPDAMEGWTDPERGFELAALVLEHKPNVVVEIGVFGGRSLLAMALALKQNGKGKIYGIDPWKKQAATAESPANKKWWNAVDLDKIHKGAMHAIWLLNLDEQAIIIRAESQRVWNLFPVIDLLNVDGNHNEECSMRDVTLYVPHVRPGGLVFMDDTGWFEDDTKKPTTAKAVEYVSRSCRLVKDYKNAKLFEKL